MNIQPLTESASSSGFQRKVSSAWEDLMATGRCDPRLVRDIILASWRRCMQSAAPHRDARQMLMVPRDTLLGSRQRNRDFRDAARGVMSSLAHTLGAARSIVLVTDIDGVILDAYGTARNLDFAADINLRPGGNCSEAVGGTNAIGTALAVGAPAQVHADEHFYEYAKGWTCSAAIVRDPMDRSILGVLDISGTHETFSAHNLALAISVAAQIEAVLKIRETQNRIRLLERCNEESSAWRDDGVVVLDSKRRLVSYNKHVGPWLFEAGVPGTTDTALAELSGALRRGNASRPAWIEEDGIVPVRIDGCDMGYLVVLPRGRRHGSTSVSPDIEAKTSRPVARAVDRAATDPTPVDEPSPPPLGALERAERDQIASSLVACGYNLVSSARALGIARSTLYVKMRRYGLNRSFGAHRRRTSP